MPFGHLSLDIDSPLVGPLENLLDEALAAVPHWILWALAGEGLRLPRRELAG